MTHMLGKKYDSYVGEKVGLICLGKSMTHMLGKKYDSC